MSAIACREAEAALLGCLLRMTVFTGRATCLQLRDDDLTDPRHRLVLAGIRATLERDVAPDPVTVLGVLRHLGLETSFLDDKGAGVVLAELYAAAPVVENAGHYLRIVLEHAFRRRIVETSERLEQVAGTASLEALRDVLDREWSALHRSYGRLEPTWTIAALGEMGQVA